MSGVRFDDPPDDRSRSDRFRAFSASRTEHPAPFTRADGESVGRSARGKPSAENSVG
ncbi:hypothetical protein [Haladaptatus salinisoli]|uniref:hypothetical protein n=1 Tax=Haladaptatus salinisoli TaxID=2884876 RepID=UPI001D0B3958|nr:hypothetical protein [Haladaptatus salinisoli]